MEREGPEVHMETDEARGGTTPHIVRWILIISLLAAIVLLSAIWIFGAATQGDVEEEATVSGTLESRDNEGFRDDIDGITIDNADEIEGAEEEFPDTPLDPIPNEAGTNEGL